MLFSFDEFKEISRSQPYIYRSVEVQLLDSIINFAQATREDTLNTNVSSSEITICSTIIEFSRYYFTLFISCKNTYMYMYLSSKVR